MWINQPSRLQVQHKYNCRNVLAMIGDGSQFVTVWFTSGDVVSMRIDVLCLSPGWV